MGVLFIHGFYSVVFPPDPQNGESIADSYTRVRADQTHVVIGEGGRFLRIPEVTAEDSGEPDCGNDATTPV